MPDSLSPKNRGIAICITKTYFQKGWACLSGLMAFVIYWLTLAPTLQVADAGEQIAAAHFMGISHPTGTPLYLLLMKFWESVLPFGTLAWRMNLLNAVLSSVAVGILAQWFFRLSLHWGASRGRAGLLSLCLSLTLAYSQTFWYESVAASSCVPHYLLVILWLTLMSRVIVEKETRLLKSVCFVTGLALANHILSLVLLALVVWTLLSFVIRKKISLKKALAWSLFLLPGLCLYLYIPIRAAADPVINWGDPDSLDRFLRYISRRDYFINTYVADAGDLLEVLLFHAKCFLSEATPVLPALALASGVMALMRKTSAEAAFQLALLGVALFILNEFLLSLHGSHLDLFLLKRYSAPGYIGLYFACAVFMAWTLASCSRRVFAFLVVVVAFIPVLSLVWNYEKNDRSQNTLLKSYAEQLLSHLPAGATLYAEGDNHLFPILYYHLVEGYRPDIVLLNPRIGLGHEADMAPLIREGQLYTTHWVQTQEPVRCRPAGLVFKLAEGDTPLQTIEWRDFTEEEIRRVRAPLEKILVAEYFHRRALYHRSRGENGEAIAWVKKMDSVAHGYDQTLMLTGYAFANLGRIPESLKYFEAALKINPKNQGSRSYLRKYGGKD